MSKARDISDVQGRIGDSGALSWRNKIINGKMEIAQRGTSATSVGYSTVDRFIITTGSVAVNTVTNSQQADAPSGTGFTKSYRVTATVATPTINAQALCAIQQVVEGYNIVDLVGNALTLSFWAKSSKTGTHSVVFCNATPDRSYVAEYTISAANTWERKTITMPAGLPSDGTWDYTSGAGLRVYFTVAVGSGYAAAPGSWVSGSGKFGSTNQVNVLDTVGNIFAVTGVQLEEGSVATPFEQRPYGVEMALCQRYYQNHSGVYALVINASAANANSKPFPVPMRVVPTVVCTPSSGSGATFAATAINFAQAGIHSGDVTVPVLTFSAEL